MKPLTQSPTDSIPAGPDRFGVAPGGSLRYVGAGNNPQRTTMKRLLAVLAGWLPLVAFTVTAQSVWLEDLPEALKKAKAENKHVLINFTGSDWCGFCIKLQKEVLSTKEFADYATKHLVLVELDFPRQKAQSEARKSANRKLQKQYKVEGFPTLVLLDPQGKEVARMVGYGGGGFAVVKQKLRLPNAP
ncbi:MAG: thioredoxin family protein [Limisphaera sp.]|nr:thioredoxin family protein [Limisphaera sp.]